MGVGKRAPRWCPCCQPGTQALKGDPSPNSALESPTVPLPDEGLKAGRSRHSVPLIVWGEVCRKDVGVGQTVHPAKGRASCHTRGEMELPSPAPPAVRLVTVSPLVRLKPQGPERMRALDILSSKEWISHPREACEKETHRNSSLLFEEQPLACPLAPSLPWQGPVQLPWHQAPSSLPFGSCQCPPWPSSCRSSWSRPSCHWVQVSAPGPLPEGPEPRLLTPPCPSLHCSGGRPAGDACSKAFPPIPTAREPRGPGLPHCFGAVFVPIAHCFCYCSCVSVRPPCWTSSFVPEPSIVVLPLLLHTAPHRMRGEAPAPSSWELKGNRNSDFLCVCQRSSITRGNWNL